MTDRNWRIHQTSHGFFSFTHIILSLLWRLTTGSLISSFSGVDPEESFSYSSCVYLCDNYRVNNCMLYEWAFTYSTEDKNRKAHFLCPFSSRIGWEIDQTCIETVLCLYLFFIRFLKDKKKRRALILVHRLNLFNFYFYLFHQENRE